MVVDEMIVAGPRVGDWSGLVQRVMIAVEVMSEYMPPEEKVQDVVQNGRQALQELGARVCSAAQREGYDDEDLAGEQRQTAGDGRRQRVGDQKV